MRNTYKYIFAAAIAALVSFSAGAQKSAEEAISAKKSVIVDGEGNAKIRLETYVTGDGENSTVVSTVSKPVDVVLVLDESGSMAQSMKVPCYYPVMHTSQVCSTYLSAPYGRDDAGNYVKLTSTSKYNNQLGKYVYTYTYNGQPYSGYIYKKVDSGCRMDVLKQAIASFVDLIEKSSSKDDPHRIAVVTFAKDPVTLTGLTDDFAAVETLVGQMSSGKGPETRPDRGLESAQTILNPVTRNSTKIVVLRDIVTTNFEVPESGSVSFKVASFTNPAGSTVDNGTWGPEVDDDPALEGVTYVRTVNDEGKTFIDVRGFDFNSNWVGYTRTKRTEGGVEKVLSSVAQGKMLVIYIDIEPSPDCDGGVVPTNEATGCGVIIGDGYGEVETEVPYNAATTEVYAKPEDIQVNSVNLIIKKSGLKEGESVLYTVTRSGDDSFRMTVVLTADASGNATAKVRVPAMNGGALYTYSVVEDSSWAWAYEPATVGSKPLYKSDNILDSTFDFGTAVKTTSLLDTQRSEGAANNVFNK